MTEGDVSGLWGLLTSDDPAQRAQGRELAVLRLDLGKALQIIDRAAREHHLQEVDLRLAGEKKLTTAVATLLKHRATLLGLDQPQQPPDPPEEDLDPPTDPEEHRRQLLRVVRRNRMRAEAGGANTAAAIFTRLEKELALAQPGDKPGPTGSDDELQARLLELLGEMSAEERAALLGGLA